MCATQTLTSKITLAIKTGPYMLQKIHFLELDCKIPVIVERTFAWLGCFRLHCHLP